MPDAVADKVKQVALEEADRLKDLTGDAVRSGAYMYPFHGIYYFLRHRALWKPLTSRLASTLSVGLSITTAMFFLTYLPQLALMAFTSGPIAPFSAALLVLSESSTLTTLLSKTLLINDSLLDTFDGTLIARNSESLVSQGRVVKSAGSAGASLSDPIARLGKAVKRPFERFSPESLIRYFMYLPLNFIPVIGTVMFVLLQGRKAGPGMMARYFQLKGWTKTERQKHIEKNAAAYTSFGVMATVLEMVPVAGVLFSFTNATGAALWAADMERSGSSGDRAETTAAGLRAKAKQASS